MIGTILGLGGSLIGGTINREHQRQMLEKSHGYSLAQMSEGNKQAYEYGEKHAKAARDFQEEMYKKYLSIGGQISQLKANGMSIANMYSNGMGGMGMSTAPQGTSSPASGNGITPGANIMSDLGGTLLSARKQEAEIDLLESEADKNREDARVNRGENAMGIAEIQKKSAETEAALSKAGYDKASEAVQWMNKKWQMLQLEIGNETKEDVIQQAKSMAKYWSGMAGEQYVKAFIATNTIGDQIAIISGQVELLCKDLLLKETQINLTNKEAELAAKEIWKLAQQYDPDSDYFKEQVSVSLKIADTAKSGIIWGSAITAAGSLIGDVIDIVAPYKGIIKKFGAGTKNGKTTKD